MAKLDDLFNRKDLYEAWQDGLIRVQYHPSMPYMIFNYTQKTQGNHIWNDTTTKCRGLIVNIDTEEVIARPFDKFFNHGEQPVKHRRWHDDEPVVVTDKLDGSLGISYWGSDGELYIATRGSFTSEQAIKANQILREKYRYWAPLQGLTYLFEIIYPDNRIVVDYHDQEDLVLLGAVNIQTGQSVDLEIARLGWDGPSATVFKYQSLKQALLAEPRPNAEGLVVHFLESDQRIKLKQDDYVTLHRIVSNLDERVVWEWCKNGEDIIKMVASLPEEFEGWIDLTANRLVESYQNLSNALRNELVYFTNLLVYNSQYNRKNFAELVNTEIILELRPAMFALLDKDEIRFSTVLWKFLKPDAVKPNARREILDV